MIRTDAFVWEEQRSWDVAVGLVLQVAPLQRSGKGDDRAMGREFHRQGHVVDRLGVAQLSWLRSFNPLAAELLAEAMGRQAVNAAGVSAPLPAGADRHAEGESIMDGHLLHR
jgi:hypothetical protein